MVSKADFNNDPYIKQFGLDGRRFILSFMVVWDMQDKQFYKATTIHILGHCLLHTPTVCQASGTIISASMEWLQSLINLGGKILVRKEVTDTLNMMKTQLTKFVLLAFMMYWGSDLK